MTSSHLFITGGAKRIGREIALDYAKQGCKEISLHYCHSLTEAEQTRSEIMALGVSCTLHQSNFLQEQDFASLFEKRSPATTLILNASLFEKDTLENVTQESLIQHLQVNSIAPILLVQAFQKQLGDAEGHIIILLDGMDGWSISSDFLSYSLSRKTMEAFIQLQATSLAPDIRINGIALGATLSGDMEKEKTLEKVQDVSPLKRLSNIEEVINTIYYLENTRSITGQIIKLNGGLHLRNIT